MLCKHFHLSITFWIFFSFSSFGTMILLFGFLIFKLLSIIKPYNLFIFSFSSDLNFFTKNFGFYFFIFSQSDIQFLSSSSLLNIVWFSTEVLLFVSHISFILNILFHKNDWKKVVFYNIWYQSYQICFYLKCHLKHDAENNVPCLNGVSIVFWNGCDI